MGLRHFGADRAANNEDDSNDFNATTFPCRVFDIVASYSGAAKVYLQLHDLATLPAPGAKPRVFSEVDNTIGTLGTASLSWVGGRPMKLGACVCISSTPDTYTAVAGNDTIFDLTLNHYP